MYHVGKIAALFSLAFVLASVTTVTKADHDDDNNGFVACGSVITQSVKLSADLVCPGAAVVIDADDVTLDLNGHTIRGTGFSGDELSGVSSSGHENVTIKSGIITGTGFFHGIDLVEMEDVLLADLILKGLGEDALSIAFSHNVSIRNLSFLGPSESESSALFLQSVDDLDINSVDIHQHTIGFNLGAPLDGSGFPTNAVIRNSYVEGADIGAGIGRTTQTIITGNHFANNDIAISSGPFCFLGECTGSPEDRTGISVIRNFIHDNSGNGIEMFDTVGAHISNNQVHGNTGCGVLLGTSNLPGFGFGSTGNKILFNKTLDNGTDLCSDSTGNKFFGNSCVSSDGAELVGKCPN